jgi:hypothetical protein
MKHLSSKFTRTRAVNALININRCETSPWLPYHSISPSKFDSSKGNRVQQLIWTARLQWVIGTTSFVVCVWWPQLSKEGSDSCHTGPCSRYWSAVGDMVILTQSLFVFSGMASLRNLLLNYAGSHVTKKHFVILNYPFRWLSVMNLSFERWDNCRDNRYKEYPKMVLCVFELIEAIDHVSHSPCVSQIYWITINAMCTLSVGHAQHSPSVSIYFSYPFIQLRKTHSKVSVQCHARSPKSQKKVIWRVKRRCLELSLHIGE